MQIGENEDRCLKKTFKCVQNGQRKIRMLPVRSPPTGIPFWQKQVENDAKQTKQHFLFKKLYANMTNERSESSEKTEEKTKEQAEPAG